MMEMGAACHAHLFELLSSSQCRVSPASGLLHDCADCAVRPGNKVGLPRGHSSHAKGTRKGMNVEILTP